MTKIMTRDTNETLSNITINTPRNISKNANLTIVSSTVAPPNTTFTVMEAVPKDEQDDDPASILANRWTTLYKASQMFQVPDLTPESMFTAYKRLVSETEAGVMFNEYYKYNTGGHEAERCDHTCWWGQMCTITNLNLDELTTCLNNTDDSKYLYAEVSISSTPSSVIKVTDSIETTTMSTVTSPVESTTTTTGANLSRGQFTTSSIEDFHNANDHSHDSIYDHDETEDEVLDQSYNDKGSVTKEKIETNESSGNAVGIFFGIVAIVIVMMAAAYGYKKYRDNRYRNQEFLLTDSVFRYDGYSQLDDA